MEEKKTWDSKGVGYSGGVESFTDRKANQSNDDLGHFKDVGIEVLNNG